MIRLMTEKETAQMVGMSVHWLRRKRWEGGGIPFIKMTRHGAVRYSEDAVKAYLEAHFRTSTSDTGGQGLVLRGRGTQEGSPK
jgi:predicted site-specific integrase-resolvase